MRQQRRIRRGVTLIELIATIVTGSIVAGSASMIMWNATKIRGEVAARCELYDQASLAVEIMTRYIRETAQDAPLTGKAQISTADASDLRFGTLGFRLTSGTLEMTDNSGTNWRPLARQVTQLAFTYYAKDGTTLSSVPLSAANRESVRVIRVKLTLTRVQEAAAVQTSVYLRNFMNEVIDG